jgi:hypothetical protein
MYIIAQYYCCETFTKLCSIYIFDYFFIGPPLKTGTLHGNATLWAHSSVIAVPSTVTSASRALPVTTPNTPGPRISAPSQPLVIHLTSSTFLPLATLIGGNRRGGRGAGQGGRRRTRHRRVLPLFPSACPLLPRRPRWDGGHQPGRHQEIHPARAQVSSRRVTMGWLGFPQDAS